MLLRDRFDPRYYEPEVLFRYHAGWAGLSFSRASTATLIDRTGTLQEVGQNVPRIDWSHGRPALRLEPGQTNVLFDSSNFAAAGTSWGTPEHWTITAATSILAGQTAYRHTNDGLAGSRERAQNRGTYTGASETFYVIVENVDARITEINLRNSTSNTNLIARLTWATGLAEVILGTGTAYAVRLADSGPNGGAVYLLAVTGSYTAGESRRLVVYPTGRSVNTETVILHHAQHVEAGLFTSPIVTGAAAPATRNVETLYFPLPAAIARPTPLTVYWRGIVGFPESYADGFLCLWSIAPANGVQPYLALLHRGASQDLRVRYHVGVSVYDAILTSLDYMPGDLLEVVATLDADAATGIVASKNGGTVASASTSGPGTLAPAWGSGARLYLNSFGNINHAVTDTLDLLILRGAGWTMDQVRAYLPEW